MKTRTVKITREIAVRLLELNGGNRKLRNTNLTYFESCLKSGNFSLTHQGIAIVGTLDNPVRLLDGQHRLAAIARTGIPAVMLVAENVSAEVFENIDGGMSRTMSDRVSISSARVAEASGFYCLSRFARRIGRAKPPAALIREIHEVISPFSEYVSNRRNGRVSITMFRCAWICEQRESGSNHSDAFQGGRFSEMPESMNAVYRRQMAESSRAGVSSSAAQFSMMVNAIRMPTLKRASIPRDPARFASDVVSSVFPEIDSAILRVVISQGGMEETA
jgi:hypothetical protein